MNKHLSVSKAALSALLVGTLAACGGSSGGTDTVPLAAAVVPTTFTVAGTAATGAVFDKATVTIIGSDGTTYPAAGQAAVVTGADGSYTITLPLTAKPPFVVQAVRDDKTLISVVAEAKDSNTNITPVTNLIASRLSTSGDPVKLAAEIKANPALIDKTKLTSKVAEVVALIKPLMDAVGDTSDPLSGKLVANGTGADKVLDSLSISITPSSTTSVNIEVAVKQKLATDGDNPAIISFTNATAPATALPAVTAANLIASGTATLVTDFLQRMTACYALPQADRVVSGGAAAGDIKADACKDLFFGKDPAGFKHNGAIVSKTSAWSSLFGTATGVKFDRGSYEFTRTNGDLVIAYRATDSSGNSSDNSLVVKTDTDAKLRAIGNQYKYNGGVVAYHQLRTFVSQSGANYYSTGYVPNVNNTIDSSGKTIFAKVVVTTPKGGVLTLQPTAGSAYLPLVKSTGVTGTNFLRLRSVYVDAANAAKDPATADTSLFFASDKTIDDAYLAAIPAQSTWKFEYYLASAPTVVDATQYYKTRARAMTIAELQTQPLAKLTTADIDYVKTNTKSNTTGGLFLPTPATGPVTLNWEVPTNALAPTNLQVYGSAAPVAPSTTRPGFNDRTGVASTARTGNIACSTGSADDKHCDSAGNFATGDSLNGAHLWASDAAGREFAHFYAFYAITP